MPRIEVPELHSFAKNKAITLKKVYHQNEISNLFHLPLSVEAYAQLHQIVHMIQNLNLTEDNYSWSYIWGSSLFSSSKAYKALVGKTEAHQSFNWLCKSFCQPNTQSFFCWLLLQDRLSTRNILRRKNMVLENCNCVLCSSQVEESLEHLFFHCPFAASCWDLIAFHSLDALSRFQIVESFKLVFSK